LDRRDVWVELKSIARLQTSRGRRCREERKRKKTKEKNSFM
jgi:hypothetical protein